MKKLLVVILLFGSSLFAFSFPKGSTYTIKKVKYFTPRGEEKNALSHLIVYKEGNKGHVIDLFCLLAPGRDPYKAKKVKIGEMGSENSYENTYLCELISGPG